MTYKGSGYKTPPTIRHIEMSAVSWQSSQYFIAMIFKLSFFFSYSALLLEAWSAYRRYILPHGRVPCSGPYQIPSSGTCRTPWSGSCRSPSSRPWYEEVMSRWTSWPDGDISISDIWLHYPACNFSWYWPITVFKNNPLGFLNSQMGWSGYWWKCNKIFRWINGVSKKTYFQTLSVQYISF